MDSSSIELPGSEIDSVSLKDGCLRLHFSCAYIVKTMTGSAERTRWWQQGNLLIDGAQVEGELPEGPLICSGGDVEENLYIYRDMIPLPLASRGRIRCDLGFRAMPGRLVVNGEILRLEMAGVPKYIAHIRPQTV